MIGSRTIALLGLALAAVSAPAFAVTAYKEPLPRVETPLCPGIVGLKTPSALTVLDRIRANAREIAIPLDDPDTCEPNLFIAFVDDPQATMNAFIDRNGWAFKNVSAREMRRLRDQAGPVRVWNNVFTKTRDGMSVTDREGLVDVPQARVWAAHSRIYTPTREDIASTVVLFDRSAVADATLAQLADYISMRAFASDFASFEAASSDSILTLFDGGAARPEGLTPADRAFLTALYAGIANLPGNVRERTIENEVGG